MFAFFYIYTEEEGEKGGFKVKKKCGRVVTLMLNQRKVQRFVTE